ncbi:DUF4345 domain-containing protein [Sandaracinobacter neustonicus]|uniref:DUF4345 domain-containing protein n=1 Tax=Sandaracinobacter neustonicus TaxID=1715348 RepID=A0A501XFR5_9SPHN|nr:DUF4345 family protein [Sandaracinobacter neustonicus]TPE59177.1 DUF4345 domain-containing protein [Sandaracinobacter neustonicus]
MTLIVRLIIGLVGLFNVAVGLMFLLNPARMGPEFALSPLGSQGLATMRADFSAFFLVGGLFALLGAIRTDPSPLKVPLLLLAIALFGRTLSLILDGTAPTAYPPMLVEAVMIALLLLGQWVFARARQSKAR